MLHIKGFSKETKREDIKNFLQDYGQIAWVDLNSGDTEVELFLKPWNPSHPLLTNPSKMDLEYFILILFIYLV